jgi:hypothetical protein
MSFQKLSSMVAIIFLILCVTLVVAPSIIYWLFGLEENTTGDFLAKRAGMLFLGLAVMCLLARRSQNIEVLQIVASTVGVAMGTMAMLGIFEFARGTSGAGIWVAIVAELLIVIAFFRVWLHTVPNR